MKWYSFSHNWLSALIAYIYPLLSRFDQFHLVLIHYAICISFVIHTTILLAQTYA